MKSLAFFLSLACIFSSPAHAYEPEANTQSDEVLGQFVSDLKAHEVAGLKDLAVKASSESRLELRISELIMTHAHTRVIHCLACREKNTDLKRIAKLSHIEHFLEIHYEGTKEHQELNLRITRVNDEKEVWQKTYIYDDQESRETKVEIDRPLEFTAFGNAMVLPKETTNSMGGYGLGFRAEMHGWGGEIDVSRSSESDTLLHLLALKSWRLKFGNELYFAAGASFLTGDTRTTWNWVIRAGYDWHFSKTWLGGVFLGDRLATPYSGLEAGLRIGFIF